MDVLGWLDAVTNLHRRLDRTVAGCNCVPRLPRSDHGAAALRVAARYSGYVETAHLEQLLPLAGSRDLSMLVRPRVGQYVVAGSVMAWLWRPPPDPSSFPEALADAVRVGFERTLEQDAAFGIRQLVDMACKALSPAVNDPFTAVQAIDHLSVILHLGLTAARRRHRP